MIISKLHYISQGNTAEQHVKAIQAALDAGCNWIQLRMKNFAKREVMETATLVKTICNKHQARLIINDFPFIAKQVNAYGLHLGLLDTPISEARKIVGSQMIIGGTANTYNDVVKRITEGADYIGLGPLRFTNTKEKLSPILGINGYRSIIQKMKEYGYKTPIIAIGGVLKEDIPILKTKGVYGIALSGTITFADDKNTLVAEIFDLLEKDEVRTSLELPSL